MEDHHDQLSLVLIADDWLARTRAREGRDEIEFRFRRWTHRQAARGVPRDRALRHLRNVVLAQRGGSNWYSRELLELAGDVELGATRNESAGAAGARSRCEHCHTLGAIDGEGVCRACGSYNREARDETSGPHPAETGRALTASERERLRAIGLSRAAARAERASGPEHAAAELRGTLAEAESEVRDGE